MLKTGGEPILMVGTVTKILADFRIQENEFGSYNKGNLVFGFCHLIGKMSFVQK